MDLKNQFKTIGTIGAGFKAPTFGVVNMGKTNFYRGVSGTDADVKVKFILESNLIGFQGDIGPYYSAFLDHLKICNCIVIYELEFINLK